MRMQRTFLTIILLLTCTLLSGCAYLYLPKSKGYAEHHRIGVSAGSLPGEPARIALLLPLQGPLGPSGQAIRNGFLSAYYYDKQQTANAPSISVIDTSSGNIVNLYQQAVNDGANFIVGPLTKQNVQALAALGKLPVPTLALNTLDNQTTETNLYQFGLSPIDEAIQVADKARQDGRSRALIIAPAGNWGQTVAQAFAARWQQQGGVVVASASYSADTNLDAMVRGLLEVRQSKPAGGKRNARPVISHRQDADMIFLVAFPTQARQIKPLLLYYYAADIPVYATSSIYGGIPSQTYDSDLNNINFVDMPWILDPNSSAKLADLHNRIAALWQTSFDQSPRLYALGIDAYDLATHMQSLATGLAGATGTLYLGAGNHIIRTLQWAKIVNGLPQLSQ